MNSSTSRTFEKRKTQDEIKKQIELLKAQLDEAKDEPCGGHKENPKLKRKSEEGGGKGGVMLAPATPSPRKKRKISHSPSTRRPISKPSFQTHPKSSSSSLTTKPSTSQSNKPVPTRTASTLFSNLRRLEEAAVAAEDEGERKEHGERTVGFDDKPKIGPQRDDRLALVEDFEMGPYEFSPPVDDPTFDGVEPHSRIALSSRVLPHADLSDYLVGRFYISPSKLYSLLRVDPFATTHTNQNANKGGNDLDVPVPGDWVTIAVIAERGPIRYTKAPVGVDKDEEDAKTRKKSIAPGPGKKEKPAAPEEEGRRWGGKKYVTLKMIDFGARSQSSSGGHQQIRGDGFLNLILFEADGVDVITKRNEDEQGMGHRRGRAEEKLYKGGSGGAFEKLMDVREGDVVALLNPKVLKPFQRTQPASSPQTTILALTPPSASSIVIIGRARDLGMCTVFKADGKVCGAWCDKRAVVGSGKEDKGGVCEFHLERAVMRRRAGRNEFAAGTSGMSTSATYKRKNDYDPQRKWGLKPLNDSGAGSGSSANTGAGLGATYVFSGHVVSNSNVAASSMFVNETMGREAQAKATRKMRGGKLKEEEALVSRMVGKGKGRDVLTKGKGKDLREDSDSETSEGDKKEKKEKRVKALYSAEFIKKLGFDPSLKAAFGSKGDATGSGVGLRKSAQDKLDALEAVQRSRTGIQLGPRPGERVRSGVVAPACASDVTSRNGEMAGGGGKENGKGDGGEEKMVDLDSDDERG